MICAIWIAFGYYVVHVVIHRTVLVQYICHLILTESDAVDRLKSVKRYLFKQRLLRPSRTAFHILQPFRLLVVGHYCHNKKVL